jgi:hypothetical protein
MRNQKLKTLTGFVVTLFILAFAFAPAKLNAQGNYRVKLISPVAGQVLYGGQQIMVEWRHTLPHTPGACESEAWLSLDGGITFTWIAFLAPNNTSLLWTVPNTPTNSAVLDIRFGCEIPYYPESYAPQLTSMFTIAKHPN